MRAIAFLRAINVGGRVVKMATLRELLEGAGLHSVDTIIASGNVAVESDLPHPEPEDLISKALQ